MVNKAIIYRQQRYRLIFNSSSQMVTNILRSFPPQRDTHGDGLGFTALVNIRSHRRK